MSVVIIDPATGGVAGLYLDAYKEVAEKHGATLVGAYASLSNAGKRYFYPYTDLASGGRQKFGRLRLPIRYAELIAGLARSLFLIARKRPMAVFYALSSNLTPELIFLLILRAFGVRTYVICHDVVPFVAAHENRTFKNAQRRQFYRFASKLICHNRRSIVELTESYGIASERIEYLPFPIMDIAGLAKAGAAAPSHEAGPRFLFIGHVRAEKGVNILVRAWREVQPSMVGAKLVIAGQVPHGVEICADAENPGLVLIDRYIGEAEYVRLIAEADFVVFPYIAGTNSGVLSNVVSLGKPVIVSDIAMFPESGLIADGSYFPTQNEGALARKLVEYGSLSPAERKAKSNAVLQIRDERFAEFATTLDDLLTKIEAE